LFFVLFYFFMYKNYMYNGKLLMVELNVEVNFQIF
jgi:hypothetical protein